MRQSSVGDRHSPWFLQLPAFQFPSARRVPYVPTRLHAQWEEQQQDRSNKSPNRQLENELLLGQTTFLLRSMSCSKHASTPSPPRLLRQPHLVPRNQDLHGAH
mmetsp:Transcript_10571/g.22306  ORF Transcript_10571/g.22306 Transcript_10571/m.22306 type:complete len:103 (-) Transcript_10571:438-746(-)